jgi:hypothetical protein
MKHIGRLAKKSLDSCALTVGLGLNLHLIDELKLLTPKPLKRRWERL